MPRHGRSDRGCRPARIGGPRTKPSLDRPPTRRFRQSTVRIGNGPPVSTSPETTNGRTMSSIERRRSGSAVAVPWWKACANSSSSREIPRAILSMSMPRSVCTEWRNEYGSGHGRPKFAPTMPSAGAPCRRRRSYGSPICLLGRWTTSRCSRRVSVPGRGGNSGWTSGVEIPVT